MPDLKVIAFDCDGVMFDTAKANRIYYDDILAHLGRPPMTDEQFAYCQMATADQAVAYLFPDENEFSRAQAFRKKQGYGPYIRYMQMAPDLIDVLQWCRPRLKTAVATNRSDTMKGVLSAHGLEDCFDFVVTALDVKHPKPHPEPLLRIVSHFRVRPEEVLYIGDSLVDQEAARGAGVMLAACRNLDLAADFHIRRLGEIKEIAAGGR